MPQLEQVGDRVAQRSDSELQRAAIADQGAHVQRDRVIRRAHGLVRWREETKVVARRIHDRIEEIRRDGRVAVHEWEIAVDLGEERDLFAATLGGAHPRCQVQREIRIAAQAQ